MDYEYNTPKFNNDYIKSSDLYKSAPRSLRPKILDRTLNKQEYKSINITSKINYRTNDTIEDAIMNSINQRQFKEDYQNLKRTEIGIKRMNKQYHGSSGDRY